MRPGKASPELMQKIKASNNLVDVVSEHVVLRKSGSNFSGLCPFHSERSPSFSVSEQKQLYFCYGCHRGGDLFAFVMEMHGLSFPEAIEELAARGRVAMPKDWSGAGKGQGQGSQAQEKLALAFKLNRFAAAFFHQQLSKVPHIESYFRTRGVDTNLQREFYLGAAPVSWDALASHFVAKQAPVQVAVDLGLIKPSKKELASGPGYFDLFRNRAMFPILDNRGRVAGFGGRAQPPPPGAPDVGGETPKYLNSSESAVFQKSKIAYGLFQAQKHIREKDQVILVEGYFDVLGMHAAGFKNVVATCGTSLTPEHLQLFKRLASQVVILFDGDKAGVAATERAMEIGLDQGQVLYGAALPQGMDPDELALGPGGREKMQEILGQAKPLLDAQIDEAIAEAQAGPEAKTQALKRIGAWLGRFKDPVGREIRANSVQSKLGISRQLLDKASPGLPQRGPGPSGPTTSSVSISPRPVANPPGPRPSTAKAKRTSMSPREQMLLGALSRGGVFSELFAKARPELPEKMTFSDLFDYFPARDFVTSLFTEPGFLERFRAAPEEILGGELDPQVRSILTEALISDPPPFTEEGIRRALQRASHDAWARFSQQLRIAMSEAEAKKDAELSRKLSEDYLDARRRMEEFNSKYDEA